MQTWDNTIFTRRLDRVSHEKPDPYEWMDHTEKTELIIALLEENKRLRRAARMIARRQYMVSGGLAMAECDAFCRELRLRPWDSEWVRNQE